MIGLSQIALQPKHSIVPQWWAGQLYHTNALFELDLVSSRLTKISLKGCPEKHIHSVLILLLLKLLLRMDSIWDCNKCLPQLLHETTWVLQRTSTREMIYLIPPPLQVLWKFGLWYKCKNAQRLVNYALMNHHISAQVVHQLWRSSVIDSRSYNAADTGSKSESDQKLVLARILLRLASRRKNKPKARIDIGKLQDEEVWRNPNMS